MSFSYADVPSQAGKTAIVTGANTGIGFEIARELAAKGARVLLACRDAAKGAAAAARVDGEVQVLALDLADLASVQSAADSAKQEPRIDLLINNAGVMRPPLSTATAGCELQFAVNHLGHFALTSRLLGKLAETPGSRVVMQSSIAHRRGKIDFANLDGSKGYSKSGHYAQSKLANLLFALELDRRLRAAGSPVQSLACHPGVAATELMRHETGAALLTGVVGALLNDARDGALPALQAATDPAAQGGDYFGSYGFMEMRGKTSDRAVASSTARDEELARRLWDVSVDLTGIDPGLPPA